jgi:c-di-GMP-binding flagellar brake protein YcgR
MSLEEIQQDSTEARAGSVPFEWGMPLMVRIHGFPEADRSTVIGTEKGVCLICSTPAIPGLWAKLRDHDQVIVRYLHKGAVYGFRCTLVELMNGPFGLMILSYPDNIELIELRKHDRIPCMIPASIKLNGVTFKGLVRDLSMEGCGMALSTISEDRLFELSLPIEVSLCLQILGSPINVSGKVVNVGKYHGKITLGSRFKDLSSDTLNRIQTYMKTMMDLGEEASDGQGHSTVHKTEGRTSRT